MKLKYIKGIFLLGLGMLISCNDDFMQKDPTLKPVEENFYTTEKELEIALNGLYKEYIEGMQDGWANDNSRSPLRESGPRLTMADLVSDNTMRQGNPSGLLDGSFKTPTNSPDATGWKWKSLRKVNYFLRMYKRAEGSVNKPEDLNKWAAEAHFFRGWDYAKKLLYLGEVPWINKDLNIDSPELYGARTPRVELVDSIMGSLNFAATYGRTDEIDASGRINKYMANFLKAKFCLFEGTFRKYHTELGLESTSDYFFQECVKACNEVINSGQYKLFNDGSKEPYWRMFTLLKNPIADGNAEAILARVYDGDRTGHAQLRYYEMNNTRSNAMGATRSLVDEYLCANGQPIYTAGAPGSFVNNPLFKGYDGMWDELDNRDPRLTQTIAKPGEHITIWNPSNGDYGIDKVGIVYPGVNYNSGAAGGYHSTSSGYRYIKHWVNNLEQTAAVTNGTMTGVEFRYGELLLMLAEAEAELGTITNATLELTVNALRERAGFDFATYPNARLTLSNIPDDPRLDAVYSQKLPYTLSPILREIRRERRVEMAQEGVRYFDLIRWKAGELLTLPMRGMKMTDDKQKLYNGTYANGIVDPADGIKKTAATGVKDKDYFLDDDGFLIAYPRSSRVKDGCFPWEDRRYYFPISLEELKLNPQLVQNEGWDDIQR